MATALEVASGEVDMCAPAHTPAHTRAQFDDVYEYVRDGMGRFLCLGAGQYGAVFLCVRRDDPTRTARAVKHVEVFAASGRDIMYAREVGLLARLHSGYAHPHIVGFVDGFLRDTAAGRAVISVVMELSPIAIPFPIISAPTQTSPDRAAAVAAVEAGYEARCDLTKSTVATPPLGLEVAKSVMVQMLSALAYMHKSGLLHRDIKPDNLLVFGSYLHAGIVIPLIKLTDFGLSRELASTMTEGRGTPYFMAPEQATRTYTSAVDIFATGCTLFAIVACAHPDRKYNLAFPERFNPIVLARHFPEGSPQRDFLALLTKKDPAARPTAAQALEHPWLRDAVDPWAAPPPVLGAVAGTM